MSLQQTSFLIDILKRKPEIANVFQLETEDTWEKLTKMTDKQRSAIHYYIGTSRFVRIKRILNSLEIKLYE